MNTLILTALAWACTAAPELEIKPLQDDGRVEVRARLPDELLERLPEGRIDKDLAAATLKLCLIGDDGEPGPAIFGKYTLRDDRLVFVPRYQLVRGQSYRAYLALPSGKVISAEYNVPAQTQAEPPTVERIYPSGDVLPANHLKFYIYFSKPMREGRAVFDRIQLQTTAGKPMPDTWRRTELWSADARRLTLWIHPGRVKQGVNLREELGPVLEPGKDYSLVIAADVCDADGVRLTKPFAKSFRTVAADYERPRLDRWRIHLPAVGTKQPLQVDFGEPLDHALAKRLIEILDNEGTVVPGKVELTGNETKWRFQPSQSWRDLDHRIVAGELLEDLAGNTPLRVFDRDLTKSGGARPPLSRTFRPRNE